MLALLKSRIKRFPMELVLTPRGKDMIPVLGPVVTISPKSILSHTFKYIQQLF
jgi:Ni,Fe-hydrogenase III small subunit